MVFDRNLESGHPLDAGSRYMENAVKLFSQVHTAQTKLSGKHRVLYIML